jgi:hypothetical protein
VERKGETKSTVTSRRQQRPQWICTHSGYSSSGWAISGRDGLCRSIIASSHLVKEEEEKKCYRASIGFVREGEENASSEPAHLLKKGRNQKFVHSSLLPE